MESCKLEIVLHSAKDLFDVKFFGTMDPYALLWITDGYGDLASTRYKTSVAEDAGCNPVWNSSMQFEVGSMKNSYILFCEINHDGTLFNRKIGEVRVPFTDLLSKNALGIKVSYPVKLDTGEIAGKIIMSHKFSNPAVMSSGANNTSNKVSGTSGANDTNKVSAITGANNTSSQVSGTSGAKKMSKVKVYGTSGSKRTSKVSRTSGTKNRKPRKKVQGKSIGGLVKNIAIDVVSEALLSAVTTGITLAGEYMLHDTTHDGENNDEYEYEDQYEDEDKDEDAYEYEYEDEDEDAYEYEDEDEDEDDDDEDDDDDDDDDDYDDDSE